MWCCVLAAGRFYPGLSYLRFFFFPLNSGSKYRKLSGGCFPGSVYVSGDGVAGKVFVTQRGWKKDLCWDLCRKGMCAGCEKAVLLLGLSFLEKKEITPVCFYEHSRRGKNARFCCFRSSLT